MADQQCGVDPAIPPHISEVVSTAMVDAIAARARAQAIIEMVQLIYGTDATPRLAALFNSGNESQDCQRGGIDRDAEPSGVWKD